MNFPPVDGNPFCGIIWSYATRGYPLIELNVSKPANEKRTPEKILDYNDPEAHYASNSSDGLNAYFIVHIVGKPFMVTNYSLRSHYTKDECLRAWTLEGSLYKDSDFVLLDKKGPTNDLENSGTVQYQINPERHYFRIKSTEPTNFDKQLRIAKLDFYGTFEPFTSKQNLNMNFRLFSILFSVFIHK